MNATSSRSHCIVTVAVEKACPDVHTSVSMPLANAAMDG